MAFSHQDATNSNDYPIVAQGTSPWVVSPLSGGGELATFVVQGRDVATGNGKSMLSIFNAAGSGIVLKLRELFIINVQNTAVTGVVSEFALHRITGHSAGTSLTPDTYDTADSLSASATARTGGTITGEGTRALKHWDWSNDDWAQGAADVESADHAIQAVFNLLPNQPWCKPITMRAGEGIHIKHVTNTTVGLFDIVAVFTQESA